MGGNVSKRKATANHLKTVIWWLFWIIVILLLIAFRTRYQLGYIQSGSMRPTLEIGSIVVVDKDAYKETEPVVGDIIMYRAGGMEVVHRVEKNDSAHKYVITKGDNNSSEDPAPVSMEEIGGKVVMKFNAVAPLVRMIKHLDNL